ncbi:MAG: hypothetical protein WHX93_08440 [bacterium]
MAALVGVVFPYVALVIFVAGFLYRVGVWAKAPKKLNWKLYPVPHGLGAEAAYILGEWISFRMLFRHNRAVWLGSYVFHLSLAALGVWFLLLLVGPSVPWLVRLGAAALFLSSAYLFLLRLWVPQIRLLSSLVEFFNLALFMAIAALGWSLMGRQMGAELRSWAISVLSLKPVALPEEGALVLLVFLVEFFLAYLPFSKMFHAASKYFAFHKSRWLNPYEMTH